MLSFKLTVGRVAIAAEDMVSNEAIAHFIIKNHSLATSYLYGYLKNFNYDSLGSTSSIATAINSDNIKMMKILVPSMNIQYDYEKTLKPVYMMVKLNALESEKLAEIRDLLLPKLMSGRIRAPISENVSGSS